MFFIFYIRFSFNVHILIIIITITIIIHGSHSYCYIIPNAYVVHILLSCCPVLGLLSESLIVTYTALHFASKLEVKLCRVYLSSCSALCFSQMQTCYIWCTCWRSLLMCASMHCETDLRARILGNISKSSQDIWLRVTLTDCRYLHETCDLYFLQSPVCRVMSCSILPMISCQRQRGGGAPRRNVFVSNR